MNKSESIKELSAALVSAQSIMGGAKKAANNPFFKSKYADLGEVIRVVREAFEPNDLAFVQMPISNELGAGVETIIIHKSGEWISNEFILKCAKLDPQGMGSAITYAKRYGLQAAAGIPSEDDDGNYATRQPKEPDMTKEDAVGLLAAAKDIKELGAAWNKVPVNLKQNEDVLGIKDARKVELG